MREPFQTKRITTEELAYWFFRLNGCLTIVNFLVHGESRGHEGTDADILAIRLPYRRELALSRRPMDDHSCFRVADTGPLIDVIIAEVKAGRCSLNGPWTDPARMNMNRVLHAIGAFPDATVQEVAAALYERSYYEGSGYRVRLFALGRETNGELADTVIQLTWREVAGWIFDRLREYRDIKAQHRQWDSTGQALYDMVVARWNHRECFVQDVLNHLTPQS